ncbi:MAG: hypothetical protein UW05_C0034G0003 [Candidatus Giovannonibacteria bacterium GW2011_GWC2_43_8]|nr:MAG: hypothetical protein UW05_C0034G0003 [Candidatus Giovannonibacteria bacterium GW2011_GWC2_43_8]
MLNKAGLLPAVRALRVREDGVQFSAPRQDFARAHSKVVLRGIRIAEAGVQFSLGPKIL